jgi:hypothetical protein
LRLTWALFSAEPFERWRQDMTISSRNAPADETGSNPPRFHWLVPIWPKFVGLGVLLVALLSVNYTGFGFSSSILDRPFQLMAVAAADTVVFGYFVMVSTWRGPRLWSALFLIFYGVNYVLTVMEAVYLPTVLPANTVGSLLINGAIVAAVFSFVAVLLLAERPGRPSPSGERLVMPRTEWVEKVAGAAVAYVALFIVFGLVVYDPLARALNAAAFAAEQSSMAVTNAALIFPTELARGAVWALLSVPAIMALPFGWKKTGAVLAVLIAVPLSGMILLSTTIASGLVAAHFAEVLGENLVFGFAIVWILQLKGRLPSLDNSEVRLPRDAIRQAHLH